MRLLELATSLLLLSLAVSTPGRAATITNADLPSSIQSCIAANTCSVSNSSEYDSATASAFAITENTGGGPVTDVLMRYMLASPSGYSDSNPTQSGTYSGYLWVLAQTFYSASETAHPVTLYLDKVSPLPNMYLFNQYGDLTLTMSTADLVVGSGYITLACCSGGGSSSGDLSGDIPYPCVADGCTSHAQLNLPQMAYGNFGSVIALYGFTSSDTRSLVYTQSSSYSGYNGDNGADSYNYVQSFNIGIVPLPASFWLFGSGLVGFVGVTRRKAL